jgi:sugar-specific transcriptional regulator TrmB
MFPEEEGDLLTQIGFTKTQAKVYLSLLKIGKATGKTISEQSHVTRQIVYRTLDELQERGLVEKEIAMPCEFKAAPVQDGLQTLILQKFEQYKEIQQKTERFLQEIQANKGDADYEQEHKFTMINGKERLIQKIKRQHDHAQRSVDVLSTLQRWLQILQECSDNYEKALSRGVKYRVVVEEHGQEVDFPETVQDLLSKPNFELRLSRGPLKTNAAMFDCEECSFSFYPAKAMGESPLILTNHPSFVAMFEDHFENVWKHSHKFKMQNTKRKNEKRKT